MRFTIERMRTLVLVAGVLLVVALGAFLAIGKIKSPFNRRDLPKRLGIDIQQVANGFTHAEFHAGHTTFKITASKVEQLKDGHFRLHVVKIEMYGANGKGVDRIEGNEFEYDQKAGIANAAGPVEITLTRPQDKPADVSGATGSKSLDLKPVTGTLAGAAPNAEAGQIHVETSGLTFNQNTGIAQTGQPVAFSMAQGNGSSVGASYDSQQGQLVLNRAVELTTDRNGEQVKLHAQHAEFNRDDQVCNLIAAVTEYRGGKAKAEAATVLFRDDGSAEHIDASKDLELTTATGGRLSAPTGSLDLNARNQPTHGNLQGGVTIDSNRNGRIVHGTSPTAVLEFASGGLLRHAHLERGVQFTSSDQSGSGSTQRQTHRAWNSPVADLEFRNASHGQAQLASIHGVGGVVVLSESQRGPSAPAPSRLTADDVTGQFGDASELTALTGVGHASIVETTQTGTRQSSSGDRFEAHFVRGPGDVSKSKVTENSRSTAAEQIEAATVIGNVVLVQQPAAKPGSAPPPEVRATADRASYEGSGEWLHLTGSPRIENGGLQLTADKIDVSQASGDAFAHNNVKATWFGNTPAKPGDKDGGSLTQRGPSLGGQGPAHVIANEAQLHQATGEATFHGHARLWQDANSIQAPVLVLDRTRQTLVARSTSASEPVGVVLVSAPRTTNSKSGRPETPSVIRVRGGDLKYSDAERKAIIHGGSIGSVVAETGTATTHSDEVELILLPVGNHAGRDGATAQVDRMTARGHVLIDSQGRKGTGDQLQFTGQTGDYALTGTAGAPPRMTDPVRGTVTGETLIFNSRDDSVDVEGGGRKTMTETTVPKKP